MVVQMAEENKDWGYRRVQGALSNLGHKLARSTIAKISARRGIEPALRRTRKTTWKEFLMQHLELIVAADFFTIEVWTTGGLQRVHLSCSLPSCLPDEWRSLDSQRRQTGCG